MSLMQASPQTLCDRGQAHASPEITAYMPKAILAAAILMIWKSSKFINVP